VAAPLADALAPFLADPTRAAILLDVDGVLAPIVRHADDAHVPEPTRAPLIKVAKVYGFVACVSGRQAAVARRIVSIGSITYVGNHGTEVLRGGATEPEIDPEIAAWVERVAQFANAAWSEELDLLRVRAEDKQAIRAFHWRGAPDEAAAEAAVRTLARRAEAEGFAVHWGRKVLEVRPPVRMDKGRGIERLLTGAGMGCALYAGDDVTDVDAFRGLRELVAAGDLGSALCVGVRSDETPEALEEAADVLVDGPIGVRALLTTLAAAD
jgi:trehalose 6-phosphate phosphatase